MFPVALEEANEEEGSTKSSDSEEEAEEGLVEILDQ